MNLEKKKVKGQDVTEYLQMGILQEMHTKVV